MHRAQYPAEPQFGWIPPQDAAAPQRVTDTLTPPIQIRDDAEEVPVWVDIVAARSKNAESIYWTPFSSDLPPTIIRPRRRAARVHVSTRVKYPVMVALTVAAISSGTLAPAGGSSAQAAPADDETTGSFRAIDPSQGDDVLGAPVGEVGGMSHSVVAGDTVRAIAAHYGVSTSDIVNANNLTNPDLIFPGDVLTIPGGEGAGAPEVTVVVEPGDTLGKIAQRYGVSVSAIVDHPANGISNPDLIHPGQELTIPGGVLQESAEQPVQTQEASNPEPVAETVAAEPSAEPAAEVEQEASNPEPVQEAAPAPNASGQQIVDLAMSYVGYPYVWGAVGPNSFDCSGFTYFVLNQLGYNVSRDMGSQAQAGVAVSPDNLQPGDIVFQQNTYKAGLSHVGIYIGDGKFVNAANPSVGVVVSNMWDDYWGPRFHSARRVQ